MAWLQWVWVDADKRIYGLDGVMLFKYDTKGALLSTRYWYKRSLSAQEKPLGKKAGSVLGIGSVSRMRRSDQRVSRKQLAGHAGLTHE